MRRLHTRIYLHLLAALCVTAAASVLVFSFGWRKEFARHWATKFARHVAAVVGDFADQPNERDRVVKRMADELDMVITVRDSEGRVLVSAGGDPLPALRPDDPRFTDGAALIGGKEWFTAAPLPNGAGVAEAAPMRRLRPPNLWRPVVNIALVLGLLALLTAPLARRISRPVELLTEGSRRLAGGDLSYRVPTRRRHHRRRRDQLDELTRAWNEMAERVESLVRGQKELLANVSHELRSPLARLRMALEASGLPTHVGRVDVPQLLSALGERAARDPNLAGKTLRLVPAPADALQLDADGALLLRALWNLVDNAGKYGAPPITVSVERSDDALSFTVADEGPGIPATERERVFDPFYRLHSDEPRRGFGLGLTLAQRVAQVHSGEITIADGESGRGCRVTLTVPIRPA